MMSNAPKDAYTRYPFNINTVYLIQVDTNLTKNQKLGEIENAPHEIVQTKEGWLLHSFTANATKIEGCLNAVY